MSTIRIAVASLPLTATLEEALPDVVGAVDQAAKLGARILCVPEAVLPGHRMQARPVPDVSAAALDAALQAVADAARRNGVVTIAGTERPTPAGRHLLEVVFDTDGTRLGEQAKTQVDPIEEHQYTPGSGRRIFSAAGVTFGIAICHEVFRYPEISRALARAGAQIIFAPHFVTTKDGSSLARWCDAANPYNEKALMCRAIENTVYVAAANVAMPNQGSATAIIAPDGKLVTSIPYGQTGVVAADLDLTRATGLIARRWAPERSVPAM